MTQVVHQPNQWTLDRKSGPTNQPLSLQDAKSKLRLSQSDTTHDAELIRQIDAATEKFEDETERAVITQQFVYERNEFPRGKIGLPIRPIQAIDQIEYVDNDGASQVVDPSVYVLNKGSREVFEAVGQKWPDQQIGYYSTTITFTAGYGDSSASVPRVIQEAILCQVAAWFYGNSVDARQYHEAYQNMVDRLLRTSYP